MTMPDEFAAGTAAGFGVFHYIAGEGVELYHNGSSP